VKKTIILFASIQAACSMGFGQNSLWKDGLKPIPARAGLDVRWEAPMDGMPSQVGFYRGLPNKFSPKIIVKIMKVCSFTVQDKKEETVNGMSFQASDGSRKLFISFPSGEIHYETAEPHYGPTNLAEGVPPMSQLPKLAEDFLKKAGLDFSGITNPFVGGSNMQGTSKFHLSEPLQIYFVGKTQITNIEYRTASFWRSVDRIPVFAGDGGKVTFGDHGSIREFSIKWRDLQGYKFYPTSTPAMMIQSLREGRAVQGFLSMNSRRIDWPTVKSVTVNQATPRYYATDTENPLNSLIPFASLDTSVDTGYGIVRLEIHCPIIDETNQ
jgi:hypothetical protein